MMSATTFLYVVLGVTLTAGVVLIFMTRRYRQKVCGPSREQCREWSTGMSSHRPYLVRIETKALRSGEIAETFVEANRLGSTCAHPLYAEFVARPKGTKAPEGRGMTQKEALRDLESKLSTNQSDR